MKRSQMDIAKFQGRVLDNIMAVRRKEVAAAKRQVREEDLVAMARLARPAQDLAAALVREPGASIIAEIKRASPSRGLIARDWDPAAMASAYVRGGAAALSCLTDKTHFQGDLAYLEQIGDRLEQEGQPAPVLRKDFIFDPYQVWEARAAGADALLLIMAVLGDRECRNLLDLVRATGMQALVEVHDEEELDRALALDARIIGVNNRNLRTFTVDLNTTRELRARIPEDRVLVGESGITTAADAATMAAMGCDAILVGEAFSKLSQSRRERKVREFAAAGSLVAVED